MTPNQPQATNDGTKICMHREDLSAIPDYPLPDGFSMQLMTVDDRQAWIDVWQDAEPWLTIDESVWQKEFGSHPQAVAERCFLVRNPRGEVVATASAWMAPELGPAYGRVHWVATRNAYAGRGLAKAMMTRVLQQMRQWHTKAILNTQSRRLGAIKVYLDFGFLPKMSSECDRETWPHIAATLKHPQLSPSRVLNLM